MALLAPALLAAIVIAWTGDQRYFTMFVVMALIAIDLDLFVYSRLFGYQARWQTYALGAVEFLITLAVVRWLAGTLPLSSIIGYYVVSWIGGYVIVHAVLPILDPMWMEHGGEVGRAGVAALPRGPLGRVRDSVAAAPSVTITLVGLVFYAILVQTVLPATVTLWQPAAALFGAAGAGRLARRWWPDRAPALQESLVLGLLLSLLLRGPGLWPFILAGALAVLLRLWPRLGPQPLFNSVAAAFLVTVLLLPGMYTSDGQWGHSLLLPLAMGNIALLIALRSRRLTLVVAFGIAVAAHGLLMAAGRPEPLPVLLPQLLPAYLVLFAGYVLPERATTPESRPGQAVMGLGVGVLGTVLQIHGVGLPFVVSLLAMNELMCLCSAVVRSLHRLPSPGRLLSPAEPSTVAATPPLSRRGFLSLMAAAGGSLALGGAVRQLIQLDPAALSLPAEAALAGGQAIPRFENVAAHAGIVLSHHPDRSEGNPAIGTGAAWGDYDRNGVLDLYVTDHMGPCHLYRNNGDGTFTDVAERAGVAHPGLHATSASFVDYDNDGWPDLYVGRAYGPNVLYRNNRDGTFTDVTSRSRLGDIGRTVSTVWADYDGDGFLDVFVVNYTDNAITFTADSSPAENTRLVTHVRRPVNSLYHNNGDGTFTDVSHLLGDEATSGLGFSAVWFDYNRDGRPDLYVAYDFGAALQPNVLWRNDGPGGPDGWRFTRVEVQMGVDTRANPMGVASGDYNNDGWPDLAVSNVGPNFLYENLGGRGFRNVAERAGVAQRTETVANMLDPSMTWGTSFADFNNDGALDLYIVAGAMDFENSPQPSSLYLNARNGSFIDVSRASGTDDPGQGRSVAVADFDRDGHLDMFVANYGQPPLLYRNVSPDIGYHWIGLDLEGTSSNRDAVGAVVALSAPGLPVQMQEVQIGQGLGSCNAKALHFGLGAASRVARVEIRWPGGRVQVLKDLPVDRIISVREPGPSRWA